MSDHYKFVQNEKCEYFPCHKGIAKDNFNCLFCYCPLYMLGENCGGNFKILESGIKSCEDCGIPHDRKNYDYIISKYKDILEAMKKTSTDSDSMKKNTSKEQGEKA